MVGSSNLKIINGQYKLKKRISSGSFGDVYLSQDIRSKEYQAVKIERQQDEEVSSVDREVVQQQSTTIQIGCVLVAPSGHTLHTPRVLGGSREQDLHHGDTILGA